MRACGWPGCQRGDVRSGFRRRRPSRRRLGDAHHGSRRSAGHRVRASSPARCTGGSHEKALRSRRAADGHPVRLCRQFDFLPDRGTQDPRPCAEELQFAVLHPDLGAQPLRLQLRRLQGLKSKGSSDDSDVAERTDAGKAAPAPAPAVQATAPQPAAPVASTAPAASPAPAAPTTVATASPTPQPHSKHHPPAAAAAPTAAPPPPPAAAAPAPRRPRRSASGPPRKTRAMSGSRNAGRTCAAMP